MRQTVTSTVPSRFENNHVNVVPVVPVFADFSAIGLPSAPLYVRTPATTEEPTACDNTVSPTNNDAPSAEFVRNRMLPSTLYTESCVTEPATTLDAIPTLGEGLSAHESSTDCENTESNEEDSHDNNSHRCRPCAHPIVGNRFPINIVDLLMKDLGNPSSRQYDEYSA